MNCPNCGAAYSSTGSFCMRCGARLTPSATTQAQTLTPAEMPSASRPALAPSAHQSVPAQPTVVASAPINPPMPTTFARPRDSLATVRHISAGSAFKVTFVTYLFLLGLIGLLVVVLPGLLGAGLLGSLVDDRYNLGALGGGIVGTLVIYVVLVVVGSIGPAILTALSVLIYNLVAGWVGGIRVRLQE